MKAILCKTFGPPEDLILEEVPSPRPEAHQVLIDVKACGVNFPDTLLIQNKYQFNPPLPFSPGGEVAGLVREVGEGVKYLKPGDRVLSLTGWGGFAEQVVADAATTLPMPPGLDFVTAAGLMYTYGTSYHALKNRAQLQPGETLLVLGAAGGVGLAALQLGVLMGARVIAAASTDEKLAVCRSLGASETINYASEDLRERLKEITSGRGVDVVYDPVGDLYTEPALRSIAWKGRYLVVGFAAGEIPKIPLNLILLKGAQLIGVFWGTFAQKEPQENLQNFQELLTWIAQGKLRPHLHGTYPLAEAPLALRAMLERQVVGKAIVVVD
ncbi:NADPH:quinone oxidoreductase family protein [Rhabdobacter roseus]|uniref:NADPH2:quinone reductase n=1 Tax=Rhabdobacter roseus TaxID=1655419 RepID=A0A840TSU5_9BACT|nr:NADPH:quinone oxidoreductase family protein [Rhabdobacter roseus]MBB5284757.1 NADPH2:quinone reductase [Rhabdobacter roseus]